jgi:formylglycine-generating enzyme required for sulfatase activity
MAAFLVAGACSLVTNLDGLAGGADSADAQVADATNDDSGSLVDAFSADGSSEVGAKDGAVDRAVDGAEDAAEEAPSQATCLPGGRGPDMVSVGAFCVDSTEVTAGQYRTFLAATGTSNLLPPTCAFKSTYSPAPGDADDYPVRDVDWCDAYAFCRWAGKRLCGQIGGGPNPFYDYAEATHDQWYFACSAGGTRNYPYGQTYVGTTCNDQAYDAGAPVPVKQASACVGGFPGLYDMAGNVWEWEDSCNDAGGAGDLCRSRGGMYNDNVQTQCAFDTFQHFSPTRNFRASFQGFRCCAP